MTSSMHLAMRADLEVAWRTLQAKNPREDFYAFGIYANDVASWCGAIACTEQALRRVSADYCARTGTDQELQMAALRWSLADSPLLDEGLTLLAEVQRLREHDPDPYDGEPEADVATERFFAAAFEALGQLDAEKCFGSGNAREKLVLSVWLNDESHDSMVAAARRLNPSPVVERYVGELESGLQAFFRLQEVGRRGNHA